MDSLRLLAPELVLSALALGLLAADLLIPAAGPGAARRPRLIYHLAWLSILISLGCIAYGMGHGDSLQSVGKLWVVDPLSQFFKAAVLISTVLCLMMTLEYKQLPASQSGTFCALMVFSAVGMMFLISSIDLLLVFVALELVSVSSFILAGFERRNRKSNEGSMKYFLFGAFSSALMVYGISLYYGATGTTRLMELSQSPTSFTLWTPALASAGARGPAFLLGMLFILLGFGFKAAMVPMHFWVPDAYEGAPMPVAAYLSVAPKIATMGVILRVFMLLVPASTLELTGLFALLAILTMTVGNTIAIFQDNVKRLLAYSAIAQAGYILIGVVCGNELGLEGVLLYSAIYVLMNIGAFAAVQAVGDNGSNAGLGSYELAAFDGLGQRSLVMALTLTVFLLSLAGLPPLAGFIGKFYVFAAAMDAGRSAAAGTGAGPGVYYALAVAGVLNSVISVYYYMRIVYHMFFRPAGPDAQKISAGPFLWGCLALCLAGILIFGVYPEPIIAHVKLSAAHLP
ncbi:MAG TPA: NADH-quinone oxidoreductase subunit N [Elusimicrobia bacterium]|nr:NADH-quinone oxidoreductase subunit N [Elusimicrobiota bacterium]HBT61726.1 NADH-quinone oxidoreductase subunit N [Elusimicrobiota bacterium]